MSAKLVALGYTPGHSRNSILCLLQSVQALLSTAVSPTSSLPCQAVVDQSASAAAAGMPTGYLMKEDNTTSIARQSATHTGYTSQLTLLVLLFLNNEMDPFSSSGELVNIHTTFTQSQYSSVLSDYDAASFSPENRLPIQILQYRAQCALGQYDDVIGSISDSDAKSMPDLAAVRVYASYLQHGSDNAVTEAERLAERQGDNLTVQLLCGTVLARAAKPEQAVQLLSKHQGSLDAVALIVQIHLSQNRTDLAIKEARSARSFAQDALLVNLAESGSENYQKAFYVFEELAQGPSSTSATSLIAQAVSELHMGRVEEAEVALNQALTMEPGNSTALANRTVLDCILGKDVGESRRNLEGVDAEHEILEDFRLKREAFGVAMGKYTPKFEP
ncbi:hypothetical protein LTR37_006770 [Vermiconidia calcicola]|uniref:Uncharacterized protein n=1 Tax=Vermiconidia calcicola TaxID=1690605 RepID=A0ACC3NFJ6_9PEZI|nr:hypothetical protein LTR37_006770 [Vermiconidia calcicola]